MPNFVYYVFTILSIVLLLNGCAPGIKVYLPDARDEETLKLKEKSIVLLRYSANIDSIPITTLDKLEFSGFPIQIARIDDYQPLTPFYHRFSPSPIDKQNGWLYLLLEPGTYYLAFRPPGSDQNPPASVRDTYTGRWGMIVDGKFIPTRVFWFHVPRVRSVVYIGSLSIACTTGRGLFGNLTDKCSDVVVMDETESAKAISQASFNQYDPMSTNLLQAYASLIAPSVPSNYGLRWNPGIMGHDLYPPSVEALQQEAIRGDSQVIIVPFPIGLLTAWKGELISPRWMKRALGRATGIGDWMDSDAFRGMGGGYPPGAIGAAYLLFYLPPAAVVGAILGQRAEEKWRPCIEELAKEAGNHQHGRNLNLAIENILRRGNEPGPVTIGVENVADIIAKASQQGLRSVFHAETPRIQLKECSNRGSFCVEIAFRGRLWYTENLRLAYDKVFLYSNPSARVLAIQDSTERPYELSLSGSSPCRTMETYCGTEGRRVLREEITRGIDFFVKMLSQELGLKP